MRNFRLHILLIVLASGFLGFSQSLRKADNLYNNRAYVKAAEIYSQLPKSAEVYEKLGDCYYYNSQFDKAYKAYQKVYNDYSLDNKISKTFYFKFFDVLRGTKKYDLADEVSTKYLKDSLDTKAQLEKLRKVVPFDYQLYNITSDISGSNFGATIYGDKIIFASTHNADNPDYKWNKKPYLDIYESQFSEKDSTKLDSIKALPPSINTKKQHESNAVFTKDGKTVYFSRNLDKRVEIDSNKVAVVSIFKSELINNEWTEAKPVSFASEFYSTMHPALNSDESKLYFSSDMPSSIGSFDIYYVDITEDGSFGEPINLGASVNTDRREQFPFIVKDSTLYFASNGRFGFGGLDLYASSKKDGEFLDALNLGETINSSYDDFAFVVTDSINKGFMSSNRDGNDNIYSFNRVPTNRTYYIEGLVTDKVTGNLLPNTTVTLFDEDGNVVAEMVVGDDAKYKLETRPNRSYSIEGFQPKYIPEIQFFNTNDSGNIEFNIELEIESYKDAEEIVTDDDKGNTFIQLENIYFDFAKWDIKPQAAKTLDVLVALLKKYPRMEIQLGAHTDSRAGYEFNMDLSEKRARATLEYLVENGIDRARLTSKGYGESQPLVPCGDNCTEIEFSINRRCEFLILK